jgi:hypothetical protein
MKSLLFTASLVEKELISTCTRESGILLQEL